MVRGWWPVDFCFCLVTWSPVFLGRYSVFKLLQTLPLVREPSASLISRAASTTRNPLGNMDMALLFRWGGGPVPGEMGSLPGTWRIFLPACSPTPGPSQAQAGGRPLRAEETTSVQPIYADVPVGQFSSCFWRFGRRGLAFSTGRASGLGYTQGQ